MIPPFWEPPKPNPFPLESVFEEAEPVKLSVLDLVLVAAPPRPVPNAFFPIPEPNPESLESACESEAPKSPKTRKLPVDEPSENPFPKPPPKASGYPPLPEPVPND